MIKVGITGQSGFVGTHLFNTLGLYPDKFERVPFEDGFFKGATKLHAFVQNCDAIVHLAAMNRHNDPDVLYKTNIELVNQLVAACESTKSTPHIIFSSSTQEECDNFYGKSKKEGHGLLEQWANKNNAQFTGLVIPNVYGPFGNPYYNSVVATFCHQLTHNEQPKIDVNGEMKLIYVGELVDYIIKKISENQSDQRHQGSVQVFPVPHTSEIKVSDLLRKLLQFKANYFEKGEIPCLDDPFDLNLFNTFLSYIDHTLFFPYNLKINSDNRGSFVETIKLNSGGQISFSTTLSGITRGNHFHTRKAERFAVIRGKATIELRRIGTDKVLSFELDGTQPSFVDMPVWYTHNITNKGKDDLYTIFWISQHFNQDDPDTYFEIV
jgi:UDP-2-acetamido-2,6-beta-L-arabino-hexul-4-ose reductase